MNLARKLAGGAIAAGIAATGLLAATPASAASGGGCDPYGSGIAACISASGSDVLPDFYINVLPAHCQSVEFTLWDITANTRVWSTGVACKDMHGGPWHIHATPGHAYDSELVVQTGATQPTSSTSPISYW
ncbi:hypothetical protein AB0N07_49755 [Streptomyces sp. NPDC051172]|uniref:hypothetical protein n=1 Tax=Streptomyces sp. NPDC051172 TaxID=3155796 RepID=UPI00343DC912